MEYIKIINKNGDSIQTKKESIWIMRNIVKMKILICKEYIYRLKENISINYKIIDNQVINNHNMIKNGNLN